MTPIEGAVFNAVGMFGLFMAAVALLLLLEWLEDEDEDRISRENRRPDEGDGRG